MAIQGAVSVLLNVLGDGTSTSFVFDLSKDVYSILVAQSGETVQNWFTGDRKFPAPVGIQSLSSASAALEGTVVTLTFSTPPPASSPTSVNLRLLFASE